ncbi:MAG: TIGR02594 family protein [Rhizobiaceae bacterium]|nr:TIGR02594 family protein [Rhizobiaceae bacterium]
MLNLVLKGARSFARHGSVCALIAGALFFAPIQVNTAEAGTYSIAKRYMGLHERKHTGKLSKYLGVNPRRTPWCGAFVGTVVKRAGKSVPAGHLRAASWKRVGKAVSLKRARKGDIVVVRTKYGSHVGFYAGQKNGRVQLLGGNQSNSVKISNYRIGSVQAVRRH